MGRKISTKLLSAFLGFVMLFSVCVSTSAVVSAADNIKIQIIDVIRRYEEAQEFLDMCNAYRKSKGLALWQLDADMTEQAMKRAAELSIYASLESPDGTVYSSTAGHGQLIGIAVFNKANLLSQFQESNKQKQMLEAGMTTAGVGVVIVDDETYVCVLTSYDKLNAINPEVMKQSSVLVNQETEVMPKVIADVSAKYYDGQRVLCGSSIDMPLCVTNMYSSTTAYITADTLTLTSGNTKAFVIENGRVKAVSPGKSIIYMSLSDAPHIKTTCLLEAVGYGFDSCRVSDIEDQFYTGENLRPGVTITTAAGKELILGTDYKVSYANNRDIGTATITITGINNYAGSTLKKNFNIIESPYGSFKVTVAAPRVSICVGETATITAKVNEGASPITYTFDYARYDTANWSELQSSTSSSCKFSTNTLGDYNVRVKAVDATGKISTAICIVSVSQQLTSSLEGPSSITLGETYNVTTKTTGGVGPFIYSCYVKKTTDSSWTTVSSYSVFGSFSYTPKEIGSYEMYVNIKTFTGYISKSKIYFKVKNLKISNTSTISSTSVKAGQIVTVKGSATGGTSPYTYSLLVKKPTATAYFTVVKYSSKATMTYKPTQAGTYLICVKAKDSSGTVGTKTFSVKVTTPEQPVLTASLSSSSIMIGQSITISASAANGESPYKYAYYYKLSSNTAWKTMKDYSTVTDKKFIPPSAGTYDICVKVKDSLGTIVKKYFTLKVENYPTLVNNSTVSASSVTLGGAVKLYGSASGGTGTYKYAYYYKRTSESSWHTIKDYSTVSPKSFTPSSAGDYDILIKVKDSRNTIVKKYFTLKVIPVLTNQSTVSATAMTLGKSITLKGAAKGGTGSYTYAYYYKLSTNSSYKTISNYSTATSQTFKPSAVGKYDICIKVKDGSGTIVKKYFTVTVSK